jgi:hypothetical protein
MKYAVAITVSLVALSALAPGEGWERASGKDAQAYPDARCVAQSSSSAAPRRAR